MEKAEPDSPYAWAVAGAAAVAQFVALGSINCFGVFFDPLQRSFHVGRASLAAVVSVANFVAPLVGTMAGAAADRYGVQWLVLLAALCQGISYFGASVTDQYLPLLLCYGVFAGIAAGCTISPSLRIVGQWFEEKRATAMGVAFAGAGLGQVLLPPVATILVGQYGWEYTFRRLSVLSFAMVLAAIVMRRRVLPPVEKLEDSGAGAILRTKGFIQMFFIGFFFSYGFFIPIVHVTFYAQSLGIDDLSAGSLLSTLGLLTTVGNVVWGGLADTFGNMQVFRICHLVSGLMLCVWPHCTTFVSIAGFAAAAGFFNGGCITCYPALAAEIFPPQQLGRAISLIYTGFGIGSLIGPIATGWIVDVTDTYVYAAGLGGTAFFLALAVAYSLPEVPDHREYLLDVPAGGEYGAMGTTQSAAIDEEAGRQRRRRVPA
eukprot:EG_transcript_10763